MSANTTGFQNVGIGFGSLTTNTTGAEAELISGGDLLINSTTSGHVGIGGTSPDSLLHLMETGSSQFQLHLESTGSGGTGIKLSDTSTHTTTAFFYALANNAYLGTSDNENLYLQTDNTTRATINSTGEVGIGLTPAPSMTLTVSGSISASGKLTLDDSKAINLQNSQPNIVFYNDNVQLQRVSNDFRIRTGGATAVTVDSSRNVGIGNSSPTKELTVEGAISASGDLHLHNGKKIYFKTADTSDNFIQYSGPGDHLEIQSQDVLLDVANGVGIGTGLVNPPKTLTVQGDISASGDFLGNKAGTSTGSMGSLIIDGASVDFTGLPTSDPGVAGRLWNDSNDLKVSAG